MRQELQNVTRVEAWSFFEPHNPESNNDYTLVSNRARLAVEVTARRFSFEGSFQYAQLLGLPRNAVGPGPLGPGALYFAAARTPQAYQLYFKSMSLTVKDIVPNFSLRVGRMPYASDEESAHGGRLIGNVEWTPFERAFDGVRVDYLRQSWRVQAAFLMPTQGVFEESANPTIDKVKVATAEVNSRWGRAFAHNYRDSRAVSARPDNTGLSAAAVDVNIQTVGGASSVAGVNVWGALQRGTWYGDSHRAFSVGVDAGHVWDQSRWHPELRGGVLYASGDDDPGDARHGTFFPMLPTTRPDLLRATFAQMNMRDVFASIGFTPLTQIRFDVDVHHLTLANRLDRWYTGTGATAFSGTYFGYSTRGSTLRTGLGTYVQTSASTEVNSRWTLSASVGHMRGGDVVRRQFRGNGLWVVGVDSVLTFR